MLEGIIVLGVYFGSLVLVATGIVVPIVVVQVIVVGADGRDEAGWPTVRTRSIPT